MCVYACVSHSWPGDIGARAYRSENPAVAGAMLGVGLVVTILAVVAVHFVDVYCTKRFKVD